MGAAARERATAKIRFNPVTSCSERRDCPPPTARSARTETKAYAVGLARAFAGAVVFSLPLRMTMEMWWFGVHPDRARPLVFALANFAVLAEPIVPAQGGFVAEVAVRNLADSTAAAVQIEGVLIQEGAVVETSRATIDHVPGRARQKAGLLFMRDRATYRLTVRATGYQEP